SCIFYVLPLPLVRRRPAWLMWWLLLVSAVVPVLFADLIRGSYMLDMPRYTIGGSLAVYAVLGALGEIDPRTQTSLTSGSAAPIAHNDVSTGRRALEIALRIAPAAVAVGCALTLPDFYQRRGRDFREMGQYLAARARPDDVILISAPSGSEWISN